MSKNLGARKLLRKFVTCQIILKVQVDYFNTWYIERIETAVQQVTSIIFSLMSLVKIWYHEITYY